MDKPYELMVLFHPDLEIDLDKPMKKVEKIITDHKGKVTATDVWGKRKLAYTMAKQDFAVYVYYEVELPATEITAIERTLNISDEVLRYLITQPVPEVEADEEAADDKETDQKSESKPDKEAKE
jgi:small subunit ribosomal protein S6